MGVNRRKKSYFLQKEFGVKREDGSKEELGVRREDGSKKEVWE
jgi:hypothetical protein